MVRKDGWWVHRHYWRPKTDLNTVVDPQTKGKIGGLIIESCSCGAIRQIEFQPGMPPVVRMGINKDGSNDKQ